MKIGCARVSTDDQKMDLQRDALTAAGVSFESITERIETSTAAGRLVFHVFAALAEFERRLVVERTVAGLSAARAGPGATADSTGHDQHSRPGSQHQPHREYQRGWGFEDHQHGQRCGCVGPGGDVEATGQRGRDGGALGANCQPPVIERLRASQVLRRSSRSTSSCRVRVSHRAAAACASLAIAPSRVAPERVFVDEV